MATALTNAFSYTKTNSPLTTATLYGTGTPPVIQQELWAQYLGARYLNTTSGTVFTFFGATGWVAPSQGQSAPITWVAVTSSQASQANYGYLISGNTSQVVITLPTVAAVGAEVIYDATAYSVTPPAFPGFIVGQNAGQQILYGNSIATTSGPSGFLTAPTQGMTIALVCVTANLIWNVQEVTGGSFLVH